MSNLLSKCQTNLENKTATKTRRHSLSSNPRRTAVLSPICINIGIIVISVKNALIDPVNVTVDVLTSKPCHFEVISCTKFEHFGIIRY